MHFYNTANLEFLLFHLVEIVQFCLTEKTHPNKHQPGSLQDYRRSLLYCKVLSKFSQ